MTNPFNVILSFLFHNKVRSEVCCEMKVIGSILVVILGSCFVYFGTELKTKGVGTWFNEIWTQSVKKVQSGLSDLKSSTAGQQVNRFLNESRDAGRDNRHGTITPEFLKARQKLLNYSKKLNKTLDSGIQFFNQLNDSQYRDRIIGYKNEKMYIQALQHHLSGNTVTLSEAREMKEEVHKCVTNITKILTDELMFSHVEDFKQGYAAFAEAFEKLEFEVKNKE